jgi:hypothetical protein
VTTELSRKQVAAAGVDACEDAEAVVINWFEELQARVPAR